MLEYRFNSSCLEVLRLQQDMNSDPPPTLKDRQRPKDRETERRSCGKPQCPQILQFSISRGSIIFTERQTLLSQTTAVLFSKSDDWLIRREAGKGG